MLTQMELKERFGNLYDEHHLPFEIQLEGTGADASCFAEASDEW